jgi:hypothetical protein
MKKKSDKLTGIKVLIDLQPIVTVKPTLMTPTNSSKHKGLLSGIYDKKNIDLPKTSTNKDHANASSVWSGTKITLLSSE